MRKIITLLLLGIPGLTLPALAFTLVTTFSGQPSAWLKMPVAYWISQSGSQQILNGSEFEAVKAAFRTWQNVSTASVAFQYMGTTPVGTVGQDGHNVVTFADAAIPLGSDVVAATFIFYDLNSGGSVIQETDIALNPAVDWSTSGEPGKWDVQGVLTHSIGHLLGLDHSALLSSVMTPYSGPGRLDQRVLTYDDLAGAMELYPNPTAVAALGSINGTVYSGSTPVFGAHVVAMDAEGTPLLSTLTWPDGTYRLNYLPVGTFRIYAEPLDGPIVEQNIEDGQSAFFRKLNKDFSTTYFGDVPQSDGASRIQISAGQKAVGVNIRVLPSSALNLTETSGFAMRIALGSQGLLTLGGSNLLPGIALLASNPGIVLRNPVFGGRISSTAPTSVDFQVAISPDTPPGPKNFVVSGNGASSVLSGGLVVVNPWPAVVQASPSTGTIAGGTATTIAGANFRSGAQVYFGGLPGTNVRVVNASSIQATTPPNIGGSTNILVVNSDGTWGTKDGAFVFSGVTPKLVSISPSIGPPTTVVTITGSELDERIQNLVVRFNGTVAKVISASRTRIDAIVPHGATTGPVTVAVSGQVAVGPSFTVTTAPVSQNVAPASFQFVDATVGSQVNLSNINDAAGLVDLPFTFSLFTGIYPAGSKVAVCTNGWLSLEAATGCEYQNGPLPGTEVLLAGGSKGSLPPALIAPFFDDLYIRQGIFSSSKRSVSVLLLGTSPNRKFVIEWSNMGILEEGGRDVGAHLTFEAILFEGSNDIQFIYPSLSGPRSDGSYATVGLQDSTRTKAVQSGYNQAILSSGYAISYHFSNGAYTQTLSATSKPYEIPDLGAFSLSASAAAAGSGVVAGYAVVQPNAGGTSPSGMAFLSSRVNNTVVSETGIPASLTMSAGRIYNEISGRVGTGITFVNANSQVATVAFYFTPSEGDNYGFGSVQIPGYGQLSRFLDQAPFYGLNNSQGTFTFKSDAPVSAVAFRGLINERGEFLMMTLPVVDLSAALVSTRVVLPQWSDGAGWSTQVNLVNPSEAAMSGTLQFIDAAGSVATLTASGQTLSTFPYSIPARSSFKLLTSGGGASMRSGWITIIPDANNNSPSAMAVNSSKSGGVTVTEFGTVPLWGTAFRSYVEASGTLGTPGSIQSGVAIANPAPEAVDVTVELTGLDGVSLGLTTSLTVPGSGRISLLLSQIFSSQALPSSLQGVLRISTSSGGLAVDAWRGRYNERGDLLVTATPPTDEVLPAVSAARYFPYVAYGGSYSTQFVLYSGTAVQAAAGSLRFLDPSGKPLPLPFK